MDDSQYQQLADREFTKIEDLFEDVDFEAADLERQGGVLKIAFGDGVVCVINTQRASSQIWMAAHDSAWHFGWHADEASWLDEKAPHGELIAMLRDVSRARGVELP